MLSGRAVVDIDAVKRQKPPSGILDPMYYLSGQLPVAAEGALAAQGGVARLTLNWVTISGLSVPKFLLQRIVTYYSRTPENPTGLNMDDPYPLPAGIKEIQVQRGQAVVVQ
jgi:hypothetical protein